jgi:hypothetical protein
MILKNTCKLPSMEEHTLYASLVQLGFSSNTERTAWQPSGSNLSVLSIDQLTQSPAVPNDLASLLDLTYI